MKSVAVVVQSVAQRAHAAAELAEALRATDVGTEFEVLVSPPGLHRIEWLAQVLERGASSGADLVLRLEDDVLVNRHLRHNCGTWAATSDPRFGVGWLIGRPGPRMHSHGQERDNWTNQDRIWGSQGMLFRTEDVATYARELRAGHAGGGKWWNCGQDIAVTQVTRRIGRHICCHGPPIIDHRDLPSTLGHVRQSASGRAFRRDWRRAA